MKVLEGHLTTTDRKVVKQMIERGMTEGGYMGTDYFLSIDNSVYSLKQVKMEWDCDFMRNKKTRRVYTSKFTN